MKKILAICALISASVISISAYTIPSRDDVFVYSYFNRLWEGKGYAYLYAHVNMCKYTFEKAVFTDSWGQYTHEVFPDWSYDTKRRWAYWTMDEYIYLDGYSAFGEITADRDMYIEVTIRDKFGWHYVYDQYGFRRAYNGNPRVSRINHALVVK